MFFLFSSFFSLLKSNILMTVQRWGKSCTCLCRVKDPNADVSIEIILLLVLNP